MFCRHLSKTMGTEYLQVLLNRELKFNIEQCLPEMKSQVEQLLNAAEKTLNDLKHEEQPLTTIQKQVHVHRSFYFAFS